MKNIKYFSIKSSEFISFLRNNEFILISILFVIGFLLRLYLINENLFFGYEQGRDLLVVREIIQNHNIVLIGPKTDIDGVFHGPFFYYLLGLPFILSGGNPLFISVFLILLNSLSIYFIYLLGKEIFNKRVGLISSVMLTFSFGSIVMARWLSNPPLVIPISCLLFYFLAKYLKGNSYYLILVATFFGLAGQVNFINYLIFGVILFTIFILFYKSVIKTPIFILILSLLIIPFISIVNYVLFDLRHNFLVTNSLINLITGDKGYYLGYLEGAKITLANFFSIYKDLIFPFNLYFSLVILIFSIFSLIIFYKKEIGFKLLLIWIFLPILIFILLKHASLYHYFAAIIVALVIVTSLLMERIFTKNKIFGLILIGAFSLLSLIYTFQNLPTNKNVFFQSTQPDLKYSDQVKLIEKIYSISNNQPFSIQAYTIPYWSPQGWEYLFWEYGSKNNKFIPIDNSSKQLFVIIQKDINNKSFQDSWLINTVSKWGIEEYNFVQGDLVVKKIKVSK